MIILTTREMRCEAVHPTKRQGHTQSRALSSFVHNEFSTTAYNECVKYVSTRGTMPPKSFSEILIDGLASDGGLVVPETLPSFGPDDLEALRQLSYPELAAHLIGLFATDIPSEDLLILTQEAYSAQRFPVDGVVPVKRLDDDIALVGLSEGPTLAFKDLAMQFLGQVIPYVLKKTGRVLNIVGATSGDTGSAAEHAFRGVDNVNVFMLSPLGRMSDVQRAQMYTITDPNIHNIAIDGVFDDCQNIVKAINEDADFKRDFSIGAINSINFGRICAQTVYYFWAWLRFTDNLSDRSTEVSFAVPSGNFGNIYSGHLARRMGLPIHRLVLATNENDVLDELVRSGTYAPRSREETLATSSPSMDISKASNLERLVWEMLGPDDFVRRWSRLDADGRVDLTDHVSRFEEEIGLVSGSSSHAQRIATIRDTFAATGVVIDPHTADGVGVARRRLDPGITTLVLETAKPEKFGETVAEALGDDAPETPAHIRELLALEQRVVELANDADLVKEYIRGHVA